MPIRWRLCSEKGRAYVDSTGVNDYRTMARAVSTICRQLADDRSLTVLFDMTGNRYVPSYDEAQALATLLVKLPGTRIAFVAWEDVIFGSASQIALMAQGADVDAAVFRERDAAETWLDTA